MPEHAYPFTAFAFEVKMTLPGATAPVCDGQFAECDGLEMSMEPKTVREGGNNTRQIHLPGPVSYGTLVLKRGMTTNLDVWTWFQEASGTKGRGKTADGEIVVLDAAPERTVKLRFTLSGCLPVKIKGPSLNAKDGTVAIEEMEIAYGSLSIAAK